MPALGCLSLLMPLWLSLSLSLSLSLLWFLRGFGLGKLIHPHSPWFVHIFQWNMISMAQTPKNRAESRSPHHCVSVSVSVSASVSVSVSVCVCVLLGAASRPRSPPPSPPSRSRASSSLTVHPHHHLVIIYFCHTCRLPLSNLSQSNFSPLGLACLYQPMPLSNLSSSTASLLYKAGSTLSNLSKSNFSPLNRPCQTYHCLLGFRNLSLSS